MTFYLKLSWAVTLFTALIMNCAGQQPESITSAIERQFDKIESDILSSAQAMPESKYDFTPAGLNIKNSDFKDVRTFAGQIMHLATDNILIWSAITGDSVRSDIEDVNGPKSIKAKKDVIEYLKSSFAVGRRAIANLTTQNAMELVEFRWRKLSRLDLAFYALTHANEHYGQMALYLRFCGIVPPPTLTDK
ncbi:MAG: DinB family protein [Ferruginibacter sp.]